MDPPLQMFLVAQMTILHTVGAEGPAQMQSSTARGGEDEGEEEVLKCRVDGTCNQTEGLAIRHHRSMEATQGGTRMLCDRE